MAIPPFWQKGLEWPCPVRSALKRTPVEDFNSFSIMFYYIISTKYQKIGDLFCLAHIYGLSHSVIILLLNLSDTIQLNRTMVIFQYFKLLRQHIMYKHETNKPWKCDKCDFSHAIKVWFLCFEFSLNPLILSPTRETDTKLTRPKSNQQNFNSWIIKSTKIPIFPNCQLLSFLH